MGRKTAKTCNCHLDQVQQVKRGLNKQKRHKYAGHSFLYRGLLRCAHCGLAITPERQKGHAYYHCTQYNGKHGAKWLREEEITKQFENVFKRLQIPKKILKQIIDNLSEVDEQNINFNNIQRKKLATDQKKLTNMMDMLYFDKLERCISSEEYEKHH